MCIVLVLSIHIVDLTNGLNTPSHIDTMSYSDGFWNTNVWEGWVVGDDDDVGRKKKDGPFCSKWVSRLASFSQHGINPTINQSTSPYKLCPMVLDVIGMSSELSVVEGICQTRLGGFNPLHLGKLC